jgi:hypothetical protein
MAYTCPASVDAVGYGPRGRWESLSGVLVDVSVVADVPALLGGGAVAEADRPLLTYCDDWSVPDLEDTRLRGL